MPDTVSTFDFQQDVLAASHQTPVLVDFWAPWCGPCRVLGPVLDRLAAETNRWTLAKVNTDEHPELMAQYGIRGIPAVKLFVDGAVAAEFTGALPEHAVRAWLDEHLPSPARRTLAEAEALVAEGDAVAARARLEAVLEGTPDRATGETAHLLLARLVVFEEPERADALVRGLIGLEADAVRSLVALLLKDPDTLPDAPVRDTYALALRALQAEDFDAALTHFIQVIQRDRSYDDDGARKAAVALFQVLGEHDPVVQKHRPIFNMSLY
ncbi:MAG: tetratricopeptide repeat protein [Rhodothermaceae bacterium]|nr:tetratricopeptide repeat protein [Rhodothermaceae bacterium]